MQGGPDLHIFKEGRPHDTDEARASALLRRQDINVLSDLGLGECRRAQPGTKQVCARDRRRGGHHVDVRPVLRLRQDKRRLPLLGYRS